ncbi:hypothetical protein SNEBB_001153 [Seison nebaliae]|nr:hypothetical protein SNEBB_001153 [Seison nebaliae]
MLTDGRLQYYSFDHCSSQHQWITKNFRRCTICRRFSLQPFTDIKCYQCVRCNSKVYCNECRMKVSCIYDNDTDSISNQSLDLLEHSKTNAINQMTIIKKKKRSKKLAHMSAARQGWINSVKKNRLTSTINTDFERSIEEIDKLSRQLFWLRGRFATLYKADNYGKKIIRKVEVIDKRFHNDAFERELFDSRICEKLRKIIFLRHPNLENISDIAYRFPHYRICTPYLQRTLESHLHNQIGNNQMNIRIENDIIIEICRAMAFLHMNSITHKNLTTRNIFYQNVGDQHITITDIGLFTYNHLVKLPMAVERVSVPIRHKWLLYQPPEILKKLRVFKFPERYYGNNPETYNVLNSMRNKHDVLNDYPHCQYRSIVAEKIREVDGLYNSKETDVFAFSTVLYEIIYKKFPFDTHYPIANESLLWKRANGILPSFEFDHLSSDRLIYLHELILKCSSMSKEKRPSFDEITESLQRGNLHL